MGGGFRLHGEAGLAQVQVATSAIFSLLRCSWPVLASRSWWSGVAMGGCGHCRLKIVEEDLLGVVAWELCLGGGWVLRLRLLHQRPLVEELNPCVADL